MITVEVLEVARAKIAQGWCQRVYALDEQDAPALPFYNEACRWCSLGALLAATNAVGKVGYGNPAIQEYVELLEGVIQEYVELLEGVIAQGRISLPVWNDAKGRTQAEVLEAFDKAIVLAEGQV